MTVFLLLLLTLPGVQAPGYSLASLRDYVVWAFPLSGSMPAVLGAAGQSPAQVDPGRVAAPTTTLADRVILVRIPTTAPDEPGFDPNVDLPLGSHILLFDPSDESGRVTNLTPGFAAAGRPDLSFDGERMLFVARRAPDDRPGVWQMDIEGTGLRRVTTESGPCSTAVHLSTIYSLDADEPVVHMAFCAGSLFTCRPDGQRIRRITFDPHGVFDPYLLSDGRLLFSSRLAAGESGTAGLGSALFTVNTDGAGLFIFARAPGAACWCGMPCETAAGQVVYVESTGRGWDRGGFLVAVDRARSLHTRRLVAGEAEGFYHSPSALGDGSLLVSYRRQGDDSYGVYVLDLQSGTLVARVIDTPEWHEVDAHVVRPRPLPAGRSTVVDERLATGSLYCLNAYLSDTGEGARITEGAIKRLQVFQAVEEVKDGRPGVSEELLGEVPVEADGSFFLEVPARTPLRWQTLDADGAVLQAQRSWVWVMPREGRGCIGCHEDRELAPPNRYPLALRRAARAVGLKRRSPEPSATSP